MELSNSVVAILNESEEKVGTGFIIGGNIILTCAHVVETCSGPGKTIKIRFHLNGEKRASHVDDQAWRPSDKEDIAVLHIDGGLPDGANSLPLGDSDNCINHSFHSYGYPLLGTYSGLAAHGTIDGLTSNELGQPILQLTTQQIDQGFSGCPVFNEEQGAVVGMVNATYNPNATTKNRDTAFAIPANKLRSVVFPHMIFLPDRQEYFFGRQKLIEEAKLALNPTNGATRAALIGEGGIGKTATAYQIASDLTENYTGGVLWASLTDHYGDPSAILREWARNYGLFLPHNSIELLQDRVRQFLNERNSPVLIIVDDVRSEWAEQTQEILMKAIPSSTSILITTRDKKLADKLGAKVHRWRLKEMTYGDGYELLKSYAPKILLEKAHPYTVESLLNVVGSLPLAVELVGTYLNLNLDELETNADDYQELLNQEIVQLHQQIKNQADQALDQEGERGLFATFKVSYQSLSEEQMHLFCQLGIFLPGVIPLEDIVGVMGLNQAEVDKKLKILDLSSLVKRDQRTKAVTLHTLLYQYAKHELNNQSNQVDIEDLHTKASAYFMAKLPSSEPETFLKAHHHAIKAGRVDLAAEILLDHDLPDRLIRWGMKDILIRLSKQTFTPESIDIPYAEYLASKGYVKLESPDIDQKQRARLYRQMGKCAEAMSFPSLALSCYQRGVDLLGDSDPRELIRHYREMAVIESRTENNLDEALKNNLWAIEKLAEFSDEDKIIDEADLYISAGLILGRQNRLDEALDYHKRAYQIFLEIGMKSRAFEALDNIADTLRRQKKFTEALNCCRQAQNYYRSIKYSLGEAQAGLNVGACLYELKEFDEAEAQYEAALPRFDESDDDLGSMIIRINLAEYKLERTSDKERVKSLLKEALEIAERINNKEGKDYINDLLSKM